MANADTNTTRKWDGVAAGNHPRGGGRNRQHPPRKVIAVAQRHLWRTCLNLRNAQTDCWQCLCGPKMIGGTYVCHIQPVRLGGSDEPWNLLLLCAGCHNMQDDKSSRKTQLDAMREDRKAWVGFHVRRMIREMRVEFEGRHPLVSQ